jgi:hypothetical protein
MLTVLVRLRYCQAQYQPGVDQPCPSQIEQENLLPFISQIPQVGTRAAENLALELFRI